MRNNILGAVVYLSTAIVFGSSTALLMLFIKENSDRCHYYNGKWSKIDLLCGVAAICAGMVVNHYLGSYEEVSVYSISCVDGVFL